MLCVLQFDHIDIGKTGVLTAAELLTGMKVLKAHQTATIEEIEAIVSRHDTKKRGGLDFEDFLRVALLPLFCAIPFNQCLMLMSVEVFLEDPRIGSFHFECILVLL